MNNNDNNFSFFNFRDYIIKFVLIFLMLFPIIWIVKFLTEKIDKKSISDREQLIFYPKSFCLIVDGARRWASIYNKDYLKAYDETIDKIFSILNIFIINKIKHFTLFMLPEENYKKRSYLENDLTVNLLLDNLELKKKWLYNQKVEVRFYGNFESMSEKTLNKIKKLTEYLSEGSSMYLNIFINYNCEKDLINGIKNIIKKAKDGDLIEELLTEKDIIDNLYIKEIPPFDIVLRTGGIDKINEILPFHFANAKIIFNKDLFLNINNNFFDLILKKYILEIRNFAS